MDRVDRQSENSIIFFLPSRLLLELSIIYMELFMVLIHVGFHAHYDAITSSARLFSNFCLNGDK